MPSTAPLPCIHRMWRCISNVWNWQKKLHEMHGQLTQKSPTPSSQSPKTQPASRWNQCTCKFSNAGLYSCIVRTAVSIQSMKLFTHGLKSLDSIPPTQHALFQHGKRALHTAAFVWKQSLSKTPKIPDPSEWGWEWNDRTKVWVLYWTDLEDVSKGCSLLLNCGCVVACKGNCKCHRAGLRCTTLCKCEGGCTNNDEEWNYFKGEGLSHNKNIN